MIKWAEEKHIEDAELVREIARLLHRQYNGVGEVRWSVPTQWNTGLPLCYIM